jgi:hypothetical protein
MWPCVETVTRNRHGGLSRHCMQMWAKRVHKLFFSELRLLLYPDAERTGVPGAGCRQCTHCTAAKATAVCLIVLSAAAACYALMLKNVIMLHQSTCIYGYSHVGLRIWPLFPLVCWCSRLPGVATLQSTVKHVPFVVIASAWRANCSSWKVDVD